jgi:formate-dependent nitrite reductase cytochrome c552 subunit
MGKGVHISYAAGDKKRQSIPWVEYRDTDTGTTRAYLAKDAKADSVKSLPVFEMQCVDCHNRAAHSFEDPDRAMDGALATGQLPANLPFLKKTGLELLKTNYASTGEAEQKILEGLTGFYREKFADVFAKRSNDIQVAANGLRAIYERNVFPDLKVTWGTYPNNLGHADFPGCFRCHDDNHATADKKTITQDCTTCHQPVSIDEASPEVLKTLGIAPPGPALARN